VPVGTVVSTVTEAPFCGVTVAGLTRQPAFKFGGAGKIEQLRLTDPLKVPDGVIVKSEVAVPFGSTANGLNADICRVKSSVCAVADAVQANNAASANTAAAPHRTPHTFKVDLNLDRNDSDLTCSKLIMSGSYLDKPIFGTHFDYPVPTPFDS
jgi:hypothetical protein